jgi:hypothetical protein
LHWKPFHFLLPVKGESCITISCTKSFININTARATTNCQKRPLYLGFKCRSWTQVWLCMCLKICFLLGQNLSLVFLNSWSATHFWSIITKLYLGAIQIIRDTLRRGSEQCLQMTQGGGEGAGGSAKMSRVISLQKSLKSYDYSCKLKIVTSPWTEIEPSVLLFCHMQTSISFPRMNNNGKMYYYLLNISDWKNGAIISSCQGRT